MTSKIASKPTTGKGEAAATITLKAHERAIAQIKAANQEEAGHATAARLLYHLLDQEVQKTITRLHGINDLFLCGATDHAEQCKELIYSVTESLVSSRARFEQVAKEDAE
jgi:hypothetical protein